MQKLYSKLSDGITMPPYTMPMKIVMGALIFVAVFLWLSYFFFAPVEEKTGILIGFLITLLVIILFDMQFKTRLVYARLIKLNDIVSKLQNEGKVVKAPSQG